MTSTSAKTIAESAAAALRPTKVRMAIAVMLFITVVINYMDRANLAIALPGISAEYQLTPAEEGLLLSAFGWTYAILQLPGGWLVDRVRPRVLYASALLLWSLATVFMGIVGGFAALIVLRLLIGGFEAPAYPINNAVVTRWFPGKERATAIGFYTSGQFIGLGLLTPVLAWLQTVLTWHWVFVATGAIGIGWAIVWYRCYRSPRESKRANRAEVDLIRAGGGLVDLNTDTAKTANGKEHFSWRDVRLVLSKRPLWGIYLGQFCLASTLWFFLTWFPTYLVTYRHMDYIKSGFLVSVPFIAALIGVLLGGFASDLMLRRGVSLGVARKTPIIIGLILSTAMIGTIFTDNSAVVIVLMSIAFFGNGFGSITWSLVSAMAPARAIGLTGGMFNFIGNLSGIATPLVIGQLVSASDFTPAFIYMTIVTVVGILSYVFLVGKVERVAS